MRFVKMHGAGNDFIVVDGAEVAIPEEHLATLARHACNRCFGIGGDGLVLALPSRAANFKMRVINSDGSEAEMCGNGIRVFAKYIFDHEIHSDTVMTVETLAGIKTLKLETAGGKVRSVRVDMGEPRLMRSEIPMKGENTQVIAEPIKVAGNKIAVTCVSMGNPHCVTFVDDVDAYPVDTVGPLICSHPSFPQRTNVEFVQVLSNKEIKQRTWERGAGETMACGTGSCASTVAGFLTEKTGRKVTVHLPGGDLLIEWQGNNHLSMTGPAEEVFDGEVDKSVFKSWLQD